jgi:hypothetical protein
VQAGGDPLQAQARDPLGDGGMQPATATAVAQPAVPQVPVEPAGDEQLGQHQLI